MLDSSRGRYCTLTTWWSLLNVWRVAQDTLENETKTKPFISRHVGSLKKKKKLWTDVKRVGRRSAFTQSEGGTQNNTVVEAREGFLVSSVVQSAWRSRGWTQLPSSQPHWFWFHFTLSVLGWTKFQFVKFWPGSVVTEDRKSAPEQHRTRQKNVLRTCSRLAAGRKISQWHVRRERKVTTRRSRCLTLRLESRAVKGRGNVGRKSCCRKAVGTLGKSFLS